MKRREGGNRKLGGDGEIKRSVGSTFMKGGIRSYIIIGLLALLATIWVACGVSATFIPTTIPTATPMPTPIAGTAPESADSPMPGTDPTIQGTDSLMPGSDPTIRGTDSTTPGTDSTTPGTDPTTPGTDPTIQGTDPTIQGTDPTTQGTDPTTQGTDPTTQGTDPTTQGTDPTTQGTDPTIQGTDSTIEGTDATIEWTDSPWDVVVLGRINACFVCQFGPQPHVRYTQVLEGEVPGGGPAERELALVGVADRLLPEGGIPNYQSQREELSFLKRVVVPGEEDADVYEVVDIMEATPENLAKFSDR